MATKNIYIKIYLKGRKRRRNSGGRHACLKSLNPLEIFLIAQDMQKKKKNKLFRRMWKCLSPLFRPYFPTHPIFPFVVECPFARLTSLFCFSPGFHYRFEGRRQHRHAPRPFSLSLYATPTQPCGNLCQIRRQPQMARKS